MIWVSLSILRLTFSCAYPELAREEASEKWQLVSSLQLELDSVKQAGIDGKKLQDQLKQAIQEASNTQKNTEYLTRKLKESSETLTKKEDHYADLARQFSRAQEVLKAREDDMLDLQKSLAEISLREKQNLQLIESLNQEKIRLEVENKQLENAWEEDQRQNSKKIESIGKEVDSLYNSLGQEIKELEDENNELKREKITLIEEKELLKDRLSQLEEVEVDGASDLNEDENINFSSVFDALKAAEESCSILEVWDSAIESVYKLNHYLPNKVYRYLLILSEVGERYFEKNIGTDLDELFRNKGVKYSRESLPTIHLFGDDRKFRHRGNTKQMVRGCLKSWGGSKKALSV